ncbi:hypothetical protein HA402_000371 [Bradysia odoriphaga]|nr:hypothetical protein HA402_000371 [Bradysia odoriphaga]
MHCVNYNDNEKIWSGPRRPNIVNSDISLGYFLLKALEFTPDSVTQVCADTGKEMTCREMRSRAIKIAMHLHATGLKQGDIVGIVANNTENVAPLVIACFTLGLPINSMDPILSNSEIIRMYSATRPTVIFCESNLVEKMEECIKEAKLNVSAFYTLVDKVKSYKFLDEILLSDEDEDSFVIPELVDVANLTAVIVSSSGTSGVSKGIMKSHKQFLEQIWLYWRKKSVEREVIFDFATLYWVSSFDFFIIATLYGRRVITSKRFSPQNLIDICNGFNVTAIYITTYRALKLLNYEKLVPLTSLQVFMAGGAPVPKDFCESFAPYLPNGRFVADYGSSEVDWIGIAFDGVGKGYTLLPMNQVKILSDGKNVGPNQVGEICVKPTALFSGYFGDETQSAEAILDKEWMLTGDVGYFDDDKYLFIVDRKKDLIKYEWHHIYPSELERIINSCEGVLCSVVCGVVQVGGNDLIVAIVQKDSKRLDLTEEMIENFINSRVDDARQIRGGVHFTESFPMTITGKIKRVAVKEIAKELVIAYKKK